MNFLKIFHQTEIVQVQEETPPLGMLLGELMRSIIALSESGSLSLSQGGQVKFNFPDLELLILCNFQDEVVSMDIHGLNLTITNSKGVEVKSILRFAENQFNFRLSEADLSEAELLLAEESALDLLQNGKIKKVTEEIQSPPKAEYIPVYEVTRN